MKKITIMSFISIILASCLFTASYAKNLSDTLTISCVESSCSPGEEGVGGAYVGIQPQGTQFPALGTTLSTVGCDVNLAINTTNMGDSETSITCTATDYNENSYQLPTAGQTEENWDLTGNYSCQKISTNEVQCTPQSKK